MSASGGRAAIPINKTFTGSEGVVNVNAGRGRIIGGQVQNTEVSAIYLVFFDALAANVTLGTTLPYYYIAISPGDNDPIVPGGVAEVYFGTAISVACVSTPTGSTQKSCFASILIG